MEFESTLLSLNISNRNRRQNVHSALELRSPEEYGKHPMKNCCKKSSIVNDINILSHQI